MKKFLIRLIISGVVLAYIFTKIDITKLKDIFTNFNPAIYLAAGVLLFLYQGLWASAWETALKQKTYNFSFKSIYRTILISQFLGMFIPTTAGPEIVLAYNIGKAVPNKEHAVSSLFFIYVINIIFTLAISGILLLLLPLNHILRNLLAITWILIIFILAVFIASAYNPVLIFINRVFKKDWPIFSFIRKAISSFSEFRKDYPVLIKLSALGIAMSLVRASIDYTLALSLGVHIKFIWFLALIPCITIISAIPVSIAGLGIREGAYISAFLNIGVPPAVSMSISLAFFSLAVAISITGGILYLARGTHIKYTAE